MDATQPSLSPPTAPVPAAPTVRLVWPRSAQLATAFLLGLATALLVIRIWGMSRWSTRPLDLEPGKPLVYRIDLNLANEPQLLQVPGIGEKTANKIEAYRQQHGPFDRVEDLTQIRGIGPATIEKWRGWVRAGSSDFEKDGSAPPKAVQAPSAPAKKALTPSQGPNNRKAVSKKEESLTAPIDVNRGTSQELQRLPGVGPKMAQRILDERAKAPFQSVDDLRRVSGIGPKILERLRPYVTIGRIPVKVATVDEDRNAGK